MIPDLPVARDGSILTDPLTLEGRYVRLEPMRLDHAPALADLALGPGPGNGAQPDVFRWFSEPLRSEAEMATWVATALADREAGRALPFVTRDAATGAIAGSTRFGAIEARHRRVEIGWTWLAPAFQRTALNTEAKLLMLTHAFEAWGCVRVEFKTDSLNRKSRAALARIGAVEEGIFRNHMIRPDGTLRHSAWFAITDRDWPAVKAALAAKLDRGDPT